MVNASCSSTTSRSLRSTPASAYACSTVSRVSSASKFGRVAVDALGALHRSEHPHRARPIDPQPRDGVVGGDQDRGGAFADRTALEAREASRDRGRRHHLLEAALLLSLRVRVPGSVAMVLDRHRADLFGGDAVLRHVARGEQREVGGRHDLVVGQPADAGLARRHRHRSGLVDAERQHQIAGAARHFQAGQPERRRARGRRVLDLAHRDAARAEVAQHDAARRHAEQRAAGVDRLDVAPGDTGVGERLAHRGEAEHDVGRLARRLVAVKTDADDVNGPQIAQRSSHHPLRSAPPARNAARLSLRDRRPRPMPAPSTAALACGRRCGAALGALRSPPAPSGRRRARSRPRRTAPRCRRRRGGARWRTSAGRRRRRARSAPSFRQGAAGLAAEGVRREEHVAAVGAAASQQRRRAAASSIE